MRYSVWLLFLLLSLAGVERAGAQEITSVRGVVWQPPADIALAANDLRKIRETGFNAVRTGMITDPRLLNLADQLGLSLYQELPLSFLSAARLRDSLAFGRRTLADLIARSRTSASARDFGIARYADTANPATCEVIAELAQLIRDEVGTSVRVYYTTFYTASDRCSEHVDYVLIDARDADDPASRVAEWYRHHETPAGIATLGTWVSGRAPPGLRNPRSPERQARYLEQQLNELRTGDTGGLYALFIYRWRDADTMLPSVTREDQDPYRATYGLHSSDLLERPAYQVVRGILSGEQLTFAFDPGEASVHQLPWPTIFAWVSILLIAILYAVSPRFRHMVPRYFRAHGFYRDAIREGRDLLLGSSLVLLLAVGLAAGAAAAHVIDVIGEEFAFRILLSWMPEGIVRFLAASAIEPWMFVTVITAVYVGGVLLWILIVSLLARTGYPLGVGQVVMLAVWPRWPLLILTFGALAVASTENWGLLPVAIIVGLWILVTTYAIIRALVDYLAIARVPAYVLIVALLMNPGVISAIVTGFAVIQYRSEIDFVVRAALSL